MVKLYVEGGGDTSLLKTACRRGFSEFLKKAGLEGHMPKVVACGSRKNAYDMFCTAIENGEHALLLIDSENPVAQHHQQGQPEIWLPWQHLAQRQGDQWRKPPNAGDLHCHLMTQCMETWFLADREMLQTFFGHGFKDGALPAPANAIENIAKEQVYQSLASATKDCKTKAPYGKGEHSFKLLEVVDPVRVTSASPWAKRLVDEAKRQMCC